MPTNPNQLVVRGGDGALFHAINSPAFTGQLVHLIPSGRGNALARHLNLFGREQLEPVEIDTMEVHATFAGGREQTFRCASSVGLGYPSDVTRIAERLRPLRRLSYAGAGLFCNPRRSGYEVCWNGVPPVKQHLTGVLVNNTRYVGGFEALPDSSLQDGLADVLALGAGYISQLAHNLSAITKTRLWMPATHLQTSSAVLRTQTPCELMLDGELTSGVIEVRVNVRPRGLRILARQGARL